MEKYFGAILIDEDQTCQIEGLNDYLVYQKILKSIGLFFPIEKHINFNTNYIIFTNSIKNIHTKETIIFWFKNTYEYKFYDKSNLYVCDIYPLKNIIKYNSTSSLTIILNFKNPIEVCYSELVLIYNIRKFK